MQNVTTVFSRNFTFCKHRCPSYPMARVPARALRALLSEVHEPSGEERQLEERRRLQEVRLGTVPRPRRKMAAPWDGGSGPTEERCLFLMRSSALFMEKEGEMDRAIEMKLLEGVWWGVFFLWSSILGCSPFFTHHVTKTSTPLSESFRRIKTGVMNLSGASKRMSFLPQKALYISLCTHPIQPPRLSKICENLEDWTDQSRWVMVARSFEVPGGSAIRQKPPKEVRGSKNLLSQLLGMKNTTWTRTYSLLMKSNEAFQISTNA